MFDELATLVELLENDCKVELEHFVCPRSQKGGNRVGDPNSNRS